MTPQQHARAKEVFLAAAACSPTDCPALLDALCAADAELRKEVERLLAHAVAARSAPSVLAIPVDDDNAPTMQVAAQAGAPQSAALEAIPTYEPGAMIGERYRIVELIGRGGMGEVYRAEDLKLGVTVALKFLPREFARDAAWLARFHGEVRLARNVSHPRVCRVHDIGDADGTPFISMEYIDGEDLRSLLRRIGRFPSDKAIEAARQICTGLAAAHARGVLHRDLKPANVMLDKRGEIKLTDFGLAIAAGRVEGLEARAGTPAYMSPEQIRGASVTTASDIYALGLVLYEMFTGAPAFSGKTMEELCEQHLHAAPAPPSTQVEGITPNVDNIICRCLEKDPQSRPASALVVSAALAGDPLAAALEAGETPSPEMVAAASGSAQAMAQPVIRLLFPTTIILLGAFLAAGGARHPLRSAPSIKPPEVLAEKARHIESQLAIPPSGGAAFGFCGRDAAASLVRSALGAKAAGLDPAATADVIFWHRRGPDPFVPRDVGNLLLGNARVTLLDPSPHEPGMSTIICDDAGRLLFFDVPARELPADAPPAGWDNLLQLADLNPQTCTPVPQTSIAPSNDAMHITWSCAGKSAGETLRVEAQEIAGQPVRLAVLRDRAATTSPAVLDPAALGRQPSTGLLGVLLAVILAIIPTAWQNIRAGRGDQSSAFRLAGFFFILRLASGLLIARHVADLDSELGLVAVLTLRALGEATIVWLLYIGLEPFARRHWPQLVISWTRLLRGGMRDGIVGQHVLVGSTVGVAWATLSVIERLVTNALELQERPTPFDARWLDTLLGGRTVLAACLSNLGQSVMRSLGFAALLVLLRMLLRRTWLAVAVFVLIVAPLYTPVGHPFVVAWITVGVGGIGLGAWLLARFGVLALAAAGFVLTTLATFPMSREFRAWYADQTLLALALVIGVALYGRIIAGTGRPKTRSSPG